MEESGIEGRTDRQILIYLLQKQEELTSQLKRRPCILLDDIINGPS